MKKPNRKRRLVSGIALDLQIAQSNLAARSAELERIAQKNSELVSERDFLRKLLLQVTSQHR